MQNKLANYYAKAGSNAKQSTDSNNNNNSNCNNNSNNNSIDKAIKNVSKYIFSCDSANYALECCHKTLHVCLGGKVAALQNGNKKKDDNNNNKLAIFCHLACK